jgi:ATP/maltotriose-dependent transcriptional regulator MalT/DNA-binding SARP family transcriptional activator
MPSMATGPRSTSLPVVGVEPGRDSTSPTLVAGGEPTKLRGYPIQPAKVQRPPLRDETLARERLLDSLNIKIHHRVVLVTAEAGYGKTTLLADFSRRTRLKTLWYRLDADDQSWIAFLSYLVAAGRVYDPSFAPRTVGLLGETGTAAPSRESVVDTFIREFQSLGEDGAALILDDYHAVDESAEIREILRDLFVRAPERVTFVLSSRRTPSVRIGRLRALGEVAEVTTDDLRFNGAETERLFRETYGQPLEADVLDDLARRTDGWVASLQLVQAAIRDRSSGEIRRFVRSMSGAEGDLYDYLAEEVVGDLPEDVQDFLMRTSLLSEVDAGSARLVTDVDGPSTERLLREAERVGLLGTRAGGSRVARAYHPLVREFLGQRLLRDRGLEFIRSLHERIGFRAWPPDWALACRHFSTAELPSEVHRVLDEAVRDIMGRGQVAKANELLRKHPPSVPTANVEIIGSRSDFQDGRISQALERARRAVELDPDSDLASANEFSLRIMLGELDSGQALAGTLAESSQDPVLRPIAQATRDMMLLSLNQALGPFVAALLDMANQQRKSGHVHYEGVSLLNAATILRAQGEAGRCLTIAREAVDALEQSSSGHELVSARLSVAWALAHLGQWTEAQRELQELRALPESSVRAEALCEAAAIHLWYGDEESARSLLGEASRATDLRPDIGDIWRTSALELAVRNRYFPLASQLARDLCVGRMSPEPAHQARQLTMTAYLALASGAPEAVSTLVQAQSLAEQQEAGFWANYCRLLRATSRERKESFCLDLIQVLQVDRAYASVLAEAITARLADADQDLLPLITAEAELRPHRWRPSLRAELGASGSPNRWPAARLLDRIGTREDIAALRSFAKTSRGITRDRALGKGLARRLAPIVRIEDQGRVSVLVGEDAIAGSDIRRKVLTLVCYLATRPAFSATRDQVLEALWPDLEPTVGLNSLNQTIYFLRRVFEPRYEEDVSPDYLRHDSSLIWLDTELVKTRTADCWDLIRRVGAGESEAVLKLSQAYLGRFALDFEYEEWAMPFRDSLHASYLHIIESTVSEDMNAGFYSRGITLARRALEIDPHAEQLEVSLLRLYRNSGAHAAAAEQYAHYATILRSELGIEPPPLEAI